MTGHSSGGVVLNRRGADRWRSGHPWIFRDDIVSPPARGRPPGAHAADGSPGDGDIVSVLTERGDAVGQAFWSANSRIALRFITRSLAPIDEAFWWSRIEAALAFREKVVEEASAYRVFSADADGIPGLIADRYGDHVVIQSLLAGVDRRISLFASILQRQLGSHSVLARNDAAMRALEGLARESIQILGETPETVEVREGPIRYLADLRHGQKTGAFLDQRENRAAATRYAHGRVADMFCYHGSFALHAARRAPSVIAVDSSAAALERGRVNAALNGLEGIEFIEANVFDFLKSCDRAGRRFETLFLDPPAFAKSRADLQSATRAYKEINLRAMRILEPGGVLVTSSCSYNLSEEAFLQILRDAAADARRRARVIERRTASRDHPVLLGLPESRYLKCFILQL